MAKDISLIHTDLKKAKVVLTFNVSDELTAQHKNQAIMASRVASIFNAEGGVTIAEGQKGETIAQKDGVVVTYSPKSRKLLVELDTLGMARYLRSVGSEEKIAEALRATPT